MLNEALQAIGPVPVALGILLLLVVAYTHQLHPAKSTTAEKLEPEPETLLQLPQSISSNIHYMGHVLGFVRDGHSYFSSLW